MLKCTYKVQVQWLRPGGEAYDFCGKITGKATLNYTFEDTLIYNFILCLRQHTGIKSGNQEIILQQKGGLNCEVIKNNQTGT